MGFQTILILSFVLLSGIAFPAVTEALTLGEAFETAKKETGFLRL